MSFAAALAHFQRGEHAAAEALLAPLVAQEPGNVDALHLLASARHARGDLDGALDAFAAARRYAPTDAALAFNHGAVLAAAGRHDEAAAAYAHVLALQPDDAEAHFQHGVSLSLLKEHAGALASYDAARTRGFNRTELDMHRGAALLALCRYEESLAAFDRVLARDPVHADAHAIRAAPLANLGRFEEAHAAACRALASAPDNPSYLLRLWHVYATANRRDEARTICERVLTLEPDDPLPLYGMADALLTAGDFAHGLDFYESRLIHQEQICARSPAPRWNGEPLDGKTVLVQGEQGFGDLFQFCRFIPALAARGARVILQERPQTRALMQTLDGLAHFVPNNAPAPDADFSVPLCSLMRALSVRLETIPASVPYLTADPTRVSAWRRMLGASSRRRIGIAWAGHQRTALERPRSLTTDALQALLDIDAEWVSLKPDAEDAAPLLQAHGVRDFGTATANFADLAALIETLDLIISVDTSVAHLAGALGKPVWIMLPFRADWRWLQNRNDTPWYPQARLFRQPAFGDWTSVISAVRASLQ